MAYLAHLNDNPVKEIQAILRSNDIGQQTLAITLPESNPDAINDLRQYIDLCTRTSKQIVMHDMITARYAQRPYGWPEMEVALLLSRLLVLGEIHLVSGGDAVSQAKLYDTLTTSALWRKTQVVQRKTADPAAIQKSRATAKDIFAQIAPDGEDALFAHIRTCVANWQGDLQQWKALADTGGYPGQAEISEGLGLAKVLLALQDSRKLIEKFNEQEQNLRDFADSYGDLRQFYETQKPTWERLRAAYNKFQLNRLELERDLDAAPALRRMGDILNAPCPYPLIQEAEGLIQKVGQVNDTLVAQRRHKALGKVQQTLDQLATEAGNAKADAALKQACIAPLERLKGQASQMESVAHLAQAEDEADRLFEAGMLKLEAAAQPPQSPPGAGKTPPTSAPVKPRCVVKPSELTQKPYLETAEDVGAFVDTLKKTMEAAIERGERIQIK